MKKEYTGFYSNPLTDEEYYSNNEPIISGDGTEFSIEAVDGLERPWKIYCKADQNWDGINSEDASDWNVIRAEWNGDITHVVLEEDSKLLTIREKYKGAKPVVIDKSTWNGEAYYDGETPYYPCYVIKGDEAEIIGYRNFF